MLHRDKKMTLLKISRRRWRGPRGVFVTNLVGLTSNRANEIRKSIREAKGSVVVMRNTLLERVGKGTEAEELLKGLNGHNALAMAFEDVPAVAKVLYDASEEDECVTLEKGLFEGKFLDQGELVSLAKLPSKDVMLATVLATMQAPVSSFCLAT